MVHVQAPLDDVVFGTRFPTPPKFELRYLKLVMLAHPASSVKRDQKERAQNQTTRGRLIGGTAFQQCPNFFARETHRAVVFIVMCFLQLSDAVVQHSVNQAKALLLLNVVHLVHTTTKCTHQAEEACLERRGVVVAAIKLRCRDYKVGQMRDSRSCSSSSSKHFGAQLRSSTR